MFTLLMRHKEKQNGEAVNTESEEAKPVYHVTHL